MERVYLQVKRIIENMDFNKIYKGFIKLKFLIKFNDYLYGLKELVQYRSKDEQITFEGNQYVIFDLCDKEINIKNIVMDIVYKMFNIQYPISEFYELKLKYLIENKDNEYYIMKYQLHLLAINVLKGNLQNIKEYLFILNQMKKKYTFYKIEEELENNIGLRKYVQLKLLSLFKQEEYNYELRYYFDILEDPTKLLNYLYFIKEYSVVSLLVNNIIYNSNIKHESKEIEKPLYSFNKLLIEKDKQIKKILMHKMIHAKKTNFKGIIKKIDFDKVLKSENLFYLPNEITFLYNDKIITKKGDYILKLNNNLEIEEGYECFSIDKILL